jgi:hypothetical protein
LMVARHTFTTVFASSINEVKRRSIPGRAHDARAEVSA